MLFGIESKDEKTVSSAIGVPRYYMKDFTAAARAYQFDGVSQALLLLHHYNLRSLGVDDPGNTDAALLKELAVKMMTA
jgi:DNA polymerase-3 subunit delta